jgi:hypothetical protein
MAKKVTPVTASKPAKPIKVKPGKKPKLAGKPETSKKPAQVAIVKKIKRTTERPDMSNNNAINVLVACPVGMGDEGNQFALTVGLTSADDQTFRDVVETIGGEDYYIASLSARATFMHIPYADLADAAKEKESNLAMSEVAQDALVIWAGDGDVPAPTPATLTCIVQPLYADAGQIGLEMLKAA